MRGATVRDWLRDRPDLVDGAVAFVLVIASVAGLNYRSYAGITFRSPDAWGVVLAVLVAAPLALRRRFPVTVAVIVISAYMALGFADYSSSVGSVAALLMIYTVGAHSTAPRSLAVTVATTIASIVFLYVQRDTYASIGMTFDAITVGLQVLVYGGMWSIARAMRARRRYLVALEDRASRLERAASAEVRAALAEERARMARELHDVVAHHVSVMTVQAGAARRTIDRAPERSVEAMRAVEQTGREALEEMRRIVGALRAADQDETDGSVQLSPRTGVAELGPLLDRAREAGLQVELTVVGEPRPLTSSVDLAIFRVVQESLTNTLKHVGPTRAAVLLRYEPEAVVVGVTDDGSPRRGTSYPAADPQRIDHGLGHGLVGMRERVTLNGGTLYTGTRMVGGFEVLATLPLTEAGTPGSDDSGDSNGSNGSNRPGEPRHGSPASRTAPDEVPS
ncbi:sensor histidine kinase [Actinopolymorpha sp. NPDC004070]|uniref:sensor histidine kinase n=1 Tax=Actinopolymorpha sp. NPDC004070 TaxID=3154548 RepID=UPI0033A39FB7